MNLLDSRFAHPFPRRSWPHVRLCARRAEPPAQGGGIRRHHHRRPPGCLRQHGQTLAIRDAAGPAPAKRAYRHDKSRAADCPRCSGAPLDRRAYSYLLGLYLGDGHILNRDRRHTLAISCSDCWPGLMDACEEAMRAVMPDNKVWRHERTGCRDIMSSSIHWNCLFPQHGPGRKHERAIVLEDWQQAIVDEFAEEFIRGLIHSDGCRVLNCAVRTRDGRTTRYYYSRYHFTNESTHIRDLFTGSLDRLGVEWRYNRRNCVSIAKRASVRRLDAFVGPKR